ncbi:MAG: N-acetyltransferase [Deltaproteobacteria bacterium]|nr:N-acetyltransferase [Deltaproteobacteria bacterium]
MEYIIRPVADPDSEAVVNIFNYYVSHSFAAFPEEQVGPEFFRKLKKLSKGYPFYIIETEDEIVGFGLMRPYQRFKVFRRTAELTYFILPDHLRKGLGTRLLLMLTDEARKLGIDTVVATLSSLNSISFNFHKKHGFNEYCVLKRVGQKFGKDFDVIYMQKFLDQS